jgi:hypothetical protein
MERGQAGGPARGFYCRLMGPQISTASSCSEIDTSLWSRSGGLVLAVTAGKFLCACSTTSPSLEPGVLGLLLRGVSGAARENPVGALDALCIRGSTDCDSAKGQLLCAADEECDRRDPSAFLSHGGGPQ